VFKHLVAIKDKRTLDSFQSFSAIQDRTVAQDTVRLIAAIGQEKHVRFMVFADPLPRTAGVLAMGDQARHLRRARRFHRPGEGRLRGRAAQAGRRQAKAMGETGIKAWRSSSRPAGLATREAILTLE